MNLRLNLFLSLTFHLVAVFFIYFIGSNYQHESLSALFVEVGSIEVGKSFQSKIGFNAASPGAPKINSVDRAETKPENGQGSFDSGAATESVAESQNAAEEQYILSIRQILDAKKNYPLLAMKQKIEGKVQVQFVLESSGKLLEVNLAKSSGSDILDQAALGLVKDFGKFPAFPAEVSRDKWTLLLPLDYQL